MLLLVFFSLIGGLFSLIGGIILIINKKKAHIIAEYATPFAAGALIAAAFTDILPEAAEMSPKSDIIFYYCMFGILLFFILERFLHWFHHHHEHDNEIDSKIPMVIIGDIVHNFIDGIAIAAGFLTSPAAGITITLAIAAHEIPQEIGDFAILIQKGMSRKKVVIINVVSALATTFSAILAYQSSQILKINFSIVLAIVAGFFIYIAVSDIIPSIHNTKNQKLARIQSFLLFFGVIIVSLFGYILDKLPT